MLLRSIDNIPSIQTPFLEMENQEKTLLQNIEKKKIENKIQRK